MEWLNDIVTEKGTTYARVLSAEGNFGLWDFHQLNRAGIWLEGTPFYLDARIDFSKVTRVDAVEEFSALGIKNANKFGDKHAVFLYTYNGRRLLIPALVLMRAIFRPSRHLLGAMFKPNSLELVSSLSDEGKVVMNSDWDQLKRRGRLERAQNLLQWMWTEEEGQKLAASIRAAAACGRIDLLPPSGKKLVRIESVTFGSTILVTKIRLKAGNWQDKPKPVKSASAY